MRLAKWENPRKKGEVRIYINGLYPFKKGTIIPKIFAIDASPGFTVKASLKKGEEFDLEDATLKFRQGLVDAGFIRSIDEFVAWDALVEFAEKMAKDSEKKKKDKPRNDRVSGKVEPKIEKVSSNPARFAEAFRLDLTSIEFPQKAEIFVDHRENPRLINLLREHPMLDVKVESLYVGDVQIVSPEKGTVIIERKDCDKGDPEQRTDFENSIMNDDKRLFNQSEKMKLVEGGLPIILLEGDVYGNSNRMLVQQIDGALSYLSTIQMASVLPTYNIEHSAYMITKLARHFLFGLGYELALRPKKPEAMQDKKAFILEGIEGVSASLARLLLHHFGSINRIAAASVEEILQVDGVGPKKAIMIKQSLN